MVSFDAMADEYAAGRPEHAAEVYDALEPLSGRVVIEGGCGTGIATRALLARGATVLPFDIGPVMLRKAVDCSPDLPVALADGNAMPYRDGSADVVCFAQSWHWLDPALRAGQAARVLRLGGRWAAWWSHARADGEAWFDDYFDLVESAVPGVHRDQRDVDCRDDLELARRFDLGVDKRLPWTRTLTTDAWLTDVRSHSYVAALAAPDRDRLIDAIRRVVTAAFPSGTMSVAYETRLWVGHKR